MRIRFKKKHYPLNHISFDEFKETYARLIYTKFIEFANSKPSFSDISARMNVEFYWQPRQQKSPEVTNIKRTQAEVDEVETTTSDYKTLQTTEDQTLTKSANNTNRRKRKTSKVDIIHRRVVKQEFIETKQTRTKSLVVKHVPLDVITETIEYMDMSFSVKENQAISCQTDNPPLEVSRGESHNLDGYSDPWAIIVENKDSATNTESQDSLYESATVKDVGVNTESITGHEGMRPGRIIEMSDYKRLEEKLFSIIMSRQSILANIVPRSLNGNILNCTTLHEYSLHWLHQIQQFIDIENI